MPPHPPTYPRGRDLRRRYYQQQRCMDTLSANADRDEFRLKSREAAERAAEQATLHELYRVMPASSARRGSARRGAARQRSTHRARHTQPPRRRLRTGRAPAAVARPTLCTCGRRLQAEMGRELATVRAQEEAGLASALAAQLQAEERRTREAQKLREESEELREWVADGRGVAVARAV